MPKILVQPTLKIGPCLTFETKPNRPHKVLNYQPKKSIIKKKKLKRLKQKETIELKQAT